MDMTGEYRIPAPRQRVWEALNDPEILKASIPGCEELHKVGDNDLEARVKAKVGPVSATFTGKVTLSDLNPPSSYRISGEGRGGAAGFAKGGADVSLVDDGDGTILRYNARADVGGKLAQIGSRLVQGTAKKMADDFFSRFTALVGERHAVESAAAAPATAPAAEAAPSVAAAPPPPPPPTASVPPSSAAGSVPSASATARTPVTEAMPPATPEAPAVPPMAPPPAPKQVAFTPERPAAAKPAPAATPTPARGGQPWWVWLVGAIILVILLFWLFG